MPEYLQRTGTAPAAIHPPASAMIGARPVRTDPPQQDSHDARPVIEMAIR
ncbi:hypothetical protein [Nocardia abscessus]|nr:hypothetical protein [Nocardia abscessus]